MTDIINWFIMTVWLFLPAYFANATPVLLHGGGPVDGGRNWSDGKRILGDHKTLYGTIAGVSIGAMVAFLQGNIIQGSLFALGAILGDMIFAFFKRRLGYPPGASWPVADQVGFIILAIILGNLIEPRPTLEQDVVVTITTIPLHYLTNFFAWVMKMKKNPW